MNKRSIKETRNLYRSLLPYGSQAEIARRIGVTPVAISQFLNGKNNSDKIELAILEMIAEKKEKRCKLLEKAGIKLV